MRTMFVTRLMIGVCGCLWVSAAPILAQDVIHLRQGGKLQGNIVGETDGGYRMALSGASVTNVPRHAVTYVVYGSTQKAQRSLSLAEVPPSFGTLSSATVHFLPPEALGVAILRETQNAKERVWIMAYYISGASFPLIQEIYGTLMDGAFNRNLDVRVVSEFSSSTPKPIRHSTLAFAHELVKKSVKVSFIQGYRTMHKKIMIIDRDKVFLGSSNLTAAGISMNDEFNVLVESPAFAEAAARDFLRLSSGALAIDKLNY